MLKAYIAGPLRAESEWGIAQNRNNARAQAHVLWNLGFSVFCPHLNTAEMCGMLEDEDTFIRGDLEWLRHADLVILLPGYRASEGTMRELKEALGLRIPVLEAILDCLWRFRQTDRHLSRGELREVADGLADLRTELLQKEKKDA